MWKPFGETKSDHNSRRERTVPLLASCAWDCERLQGSGRRRRAEERIEVAPLSPLRQCIPIHHGGSALLSCSSTSREGWEAPILSWQPSAAHSQSHIITTFIFISIDTRPFPPLKLNQRGCRKGREGRAGAGREGGREGRRGGEVCGGGLMMKCRPRPQLIAFQFACKWFHVRAGPTSRGVSRGRGWETTAICRPGTRRLRAAMSQPRCRQDPYTNPHRENKKIIISCIYELTWCEGYAHVGYFTVIKWQRTYQRVNFHRKLVLLVLHRWALMTWQRRRRIGLIL